MNIQVATLNKFSPTLVALIGLLSTVEAHVESEAVDVRELGVTLGTRQCLLVGALAVFHQFVHPGEDHTALVTLVFLQIKSNTRLDKNPPINAVTSILK